MTARPHAPAAFGAAENRLNALLDACVDAIALITPDGLITHFNVAAERLFGYTQEEVLGRNVSLLMPEPYHSQHDDYIARYRNTGEARIIGIGREVIARRKDGSTFPIELSVGEFVSMDGSGFVGILRDITQRKQYEERLQGQARDLERMLSETEALRARLTHVARLGSLGEMVSGIAHELNQPLSAIANYANASRRLVASGQAQPEELAEVLGKIAAQGERAGQVIRGLRALARKRNDVRESVDCNTLVREVVQLSEFEIRQAGFQLVLDLEKDLPHVMGDAIQIQQVVLNLVRNALDAMREQARDERIEVSTQRSDGGVEIVVADGGPGIAPKDAEHIGSPFFTTKQDGLGLGLSICHSIVSAHNGSLHFENNARGGAAFRLRLPAQRPGEDVT